MGLDKLTFFLVHRGFCNYIPSIPFWSNVSNYNRDLTVLQAGIPPPPSPCFLHSLLVCVLPWSPLSPSEFSEWKVETGRQEISAFFPKVLKNVSWDEDPGQWLLLETDSLHGMVHWLAVCNSALEWITHTLVTRRHHWCDCTRLLCCMWLLNLIVSYLKAYNG